MKNIISFLAKAIYRFFIMLDKKLGCYERFDYETAPYCGHHHCGHDGYFTKSHFHESDGGGETHGWFHRYILGVWYSNVDGEEYGFHVPVYLWCRWFYFEVKQALKSLVIKVELVKGERTLFIKVVHFKSQRGYMRNWPRKCTLHIMPLRYRFIPVSHSTISTRALSLIILLCLGAAFASCSSQPKADKIGVYMTNGVAGGYPTVNQGASTGWKIVKIKSLDHGTYGYYYTKGDSIRYIQSSFSQIEVDDKWDGMLYGKNLVSR
jgi:hypothetical protein